MVFAIYRNNIKVDSNSSYDVYADRYNPAPISESPKFEIALQLEI